MKPAIGFPLVTDGETDSFGPGTCGTTDRGAEGCDSRPASQQVNELGDDGSGYMIAVE